MSKLLLKQIHACTVCSEYLPNPPRPTINFHPDAEIMIIGQAPGRLAHVNHKPWSDPSGNRLRSWLNVTPEEFYDARRFALIPMGFCYPGTDIKGGDFPPRSECAPLWHAKIRKQLKNLRLTLLVGQYSQKFYLGNKRKASMTETVNSYRDYLPNFLPLPHPSWRNTVWLKKHPWFESEVLPVLRQLIRSN